MLTVKPVYVGKALPQQPKGAQAYYFDLLEREGIKDTDTNRFLFASGFLYACDASEQQSGSLADLAIDAASLLDGEGADENDTD